MRPAALRAKSSTGCAPLCELGSLLSALTRVRLYEAVGRKGSRRSLRQAAHGWPAVYRVRRRCHRPVPRAWAARRPSTAVVAPAARAPGRSLPGGLPSLHEGSGHGQLEQRRGARAAQRLRCRWRSSSDAMVCSPWQGTSRPTRSRRFLPCPFLGGSSAGYCPSQRVKTLRDDGEVSCCVTIDRLGQIAFSPDAGRANTARSGASPRE